MTSTKQTDNLQTGSTSVISPNKGYTSLEVFSNNASANVASMDMDFASMTSDDPYAGSTGVASTPLEEKQWLESCANSA
jgi:hypothetical protein